MSPPIFTPQNLKILLASQRNEILERLQEFQKVPEEFWFRELVICLLTPQSSPVRAEAALQKLEASGLRENKLEITTIAEVLRDSSHYVRFHNTKAKRIFEFVEGWESLSAQLRRCADQYAERDLLVRQVKGFGLKEASHALRNIGRRNLAILDRHILRALHLLQVIEEIPKTMTPKKYLEIEGKFRDFAASIGEEMDVLDLFFWSQYTGFVFK